MYAKPLIMSYIITYHRVHIDFETKISVGSRYGGLAKRASLSLVFNSPSLFHFRDDAADPLGHFLTPEFPWWGRSSA